MLQTDCPTLLDKLDLACRQHARAGVVLSEVATSDLCRRTLYLHKAPTEGLQASQW